MCQSLAQHLEEARAEEQKVFHAVLRHPGICLVCIERLAGYRDGHLLEAQRTLARDGKIREVKGRKIAQRRCVRSRS